jgi:hypothetical protein
MDGAVATTPPGAKAPVRCSHDMGPPAVSAPAAQVPLPLTAKVALAAEILATYGRARFLMARRAFPQALAELRDVPATKPAPGDPVTGGRRLGSAVVRALRLLPTDSRCLVRSLVLTRVLARRGIASTLIIGVQRGDELEAHAWVEYAGAPLLDTGGTAFRRLAEL